MATIETEQRETLATWVPTSIADELKARATEADRSVSAELRRLLVAYLNERRRPEAEYAKAART